MSNFVHFDSSETAAVCICFLIMGQTKTQTVRSALIHTPELAWFSHPFVIALPGQNGKVHCEFMPQWMLHMQKPSEQGHQFEPQRSNAVTTTQALHARRQATSKPSKLAGKVHCDCTGTAQSSVRKVSTHTKQKQDINGLHHTSNGRFGHGCLSKHTDGLANRCRGALRLLSLLRLRNQLHEQSDSHPAVNRCDSQQTPLQIPSRNQAETQHNLLPPSLHMLCMSVSFRFQISANHHALNVLL